MKKILSAILACLMVAVLASCAVGDTTPAETTSAVNTAVQVIFKVGEETIYELDITVNGDAPVVMDAVKTIIKEKAVDIAISEGGDKIAHADKYRDCTLTIDGKDVSFYWNFELNGKASEKADEQPIKEGDVITFVFTRGGLNAEDKLEEVPYDPSTNEYYDPEAVTEA